MRKFDSDFIGEYEFLVKNHKYKSYVKSSAIKWGQAEFFGGFLRHMSNTRESSTNSNVMQMVKLYHQLSE